MPRVDLPYGDGILSVEIDEDALGEIVRPQPVEIPSKPEAVIYHALDIPIGTPPLIEMVRPGQNTAIIIDDITRRTPIHLMLPPVLDYLEKSGVQKTSVSIVIALGTHRPMTESEIREKVGPDIPDEYEIVNIPGWKEDEMIYTGTSAKGIPAWVNRKVADADIRIGLGMIAPHMDVGFSGGAKIILPGVCSSKTVNAFHSRQATLTGNQLGLLDSPMRRDLEEFVEERIGLDFILNAVLSRDGLVYQCVAGHFIQAHRAGVDIASRVYGMPVSKRYPVVVSNAFPAQIDLWQSTKAIASADLMTADGGTIILVTHCPEGNSTHPLFADYLGRHPDRLLEELESGNAADPVACAIAISIARIRQRIRIALVSSGLNKQDADRMGFDYYDTIENALSDVLSSIKEPESVGVLTQGGVSLPYS